MNKKTKCALFGTHPEQFNGYSRVVYETALELSKKDDIELIVFGFQKSVTAPNHRTDVPKNVVVYDAFANEDPKVQGFGIANVRKFMLEHKPDVVIIYNDVGVISAIIGQLQLSKNVDNLSFKTISYVDQVYLNQQKGLLKLINDNSDFIITFTKYWEKKILEQKITVPHGVFEHGFNPMHMYPIKKELARKYWGIDPKDYVILNLNRNQPRKRWDICIKAFAEIVSRYPQEPIKLVIGTAPNDAWNLIEIFERELGKRDMTLEEGMKHIIVIDRPQAMNDEDTNILYNIADIGINTCDGEGFGLCNFEQAAIGIPQIVPKLGGFLDFFDDHNSILVDPKIAIYLDKSNSNLGGEALLTDYMDYVEAIENYYFNKEVAVRHGKNAREHILKNYKWSDLVNKLYGYIKLVCNQSESVAQEKDLIDFTFDSPNQFKSGCVIGSLNINDDKEVSKKKKVPKKNVKKAK
jgi:glycosyltransferase involved in cell wall biosynthesis